MRQPVTFDSVKAAATVSYVLQRVGRCGFAKLSNLLALSDFRAHRELGASITGMTYLKAPWGMAAVELPGVLAQMKQRGELSVRALRKKDRQRLARSMQRTARSMRRSDRKRTTR